MLMLKTYICMKRILSGQVFYQANEKANFRQNVAILGGFCLFSGEQKNRLHLFKLRYNRLITFALTAEILAMPKIPKRLCVRMKGLEPPLLTELDPKSSAATNYATCAKAVQR